MLNQSALAFFIVQQIFHYLSRFPPQDIPVRAVIILRRVRSAPEEPFCLVAIREALLERLCYFASRCLLTQMEVTLNVLKGFYINFVRPPMRY